jgi:NADPH:quinone reductase-like Zn-dependent oxidoreductase
MKAARIHRYGGNDVVVIDEVAVPEPRPGEVLVKVAAAGVNPVDWKLREGYMSQVNPIQFPYTLGCDVAGQIASLGSSASRFQVGDSVYGYPSLSRSGAFAEYMLILESELALAPRSIPLAEAAALPVAAITAFDGLFTHGKLEAGETVLILGGSGGVGSAAIQLARQKGATVYATASARNLQWIQQLGAQAIDYGTQATADVVRDADLLLDCVGVDSGIPALPSLKQGGRYVTTVFSLPAPELLAQREAKGLQYGIQPSGQRLSEIASIVDSGFLKIPVERAFPLEQTAQALAASQTGRTRGKLLIQP